MDIEKKPPEFGLEKRNELSDSPSFLNSSSAGLQNLPLQVIDEDPYQPRQSDNPGFSMESLKELAATIRLRNVKSPISVREHPHHQGRYIINHGARRYRASKLAGKESIPAFIDNDYNEADQVIENLQRNELTAREIADFIGRELAKGKKKILIAKEIGKSPAFVTQHATLLDLPEAIAEVFSRGQLNDVTVINELVTAYKKNPEEVVAWLADEDQELTRGSVKFLREFLEEKNKSDDDDISIVEGLGDDGEVQEENGRKKQTIVHPERLKRSIVQVQYNNRHARLILNRRPPAKGWAWLKYEDDGSESKVDLADVQLVALIEA